MPDGPSQHSSAPALILCSDIGTTAVKLLLLESSTRRTLYSASCNIDAAPATAAQQQSTMSLHSILAAFSSLVVEAADSCKGADGGPPARVSDILLCGQMHGIALWRSDQPLANCSELVTWQDSRCSSEFLATLPKPSKPEIVAPKSGFGLATLLWWQRHQPDRLAGFDACGSAMDWLASLLTGGCQPVRMSAQLAASWGYFDLFNGRWDVDSLTLAGLPPRPRLPDVAPVGGVVGRLSATSGGLLVGGVGDGKQREAWERLFLPDCRVRVPLGDLQCVVYSVYAPLAAAPAATSTGPKFDGRAFLNFGTSAQLGFVTREPPPQLATRLYPGIDCFPFFSSDSYVLLAASLNGGNVLAEFVRTLAGWQEQLTGRPCPLNSVWQRLQALADEAEPLSTSDPDPLISPTLLDERCVSGGASGGSVSGLRLSSCRSLGRVYRSLCRGLIDNLLSLCPPAALAQAGIRSVTLAGSAFRRNAVLRQAAVQRFADYQLPADGLLDCGIGGGGGGDALAESAAAVADGAAGLAAQFLDWIETAGGE